jgi:DNA (cytosine-5)-methyltransferase 1
MQGFPDSFDLHPKDECAYRQFGNSVSVPVIREVIIDFFKNSDVMEESKFLPSDIQTLQNV